MWLSLESLSPLLQGQREGLAAVARVFVRHRLQMLVSCGVGLRGCPVPTLAWELSG